MAVDITPLTDLEGLTVDLTVTGLTVGTRYDVMRLQLRYLGDDDLGAPIYEREYPDRRDLWSSVAHRVGWVAPAATVNIRDYNCPTRPTVYYVVPSASVGPTDWDFANGDYPVTNGTLDTEVVHFNRDLELALTIGAGTSPILVRSTVELGLYAGACVYDIEELTYGARGTQLDILGSPYPGYVAAARQAGRGRMTLAVQDLGQLNDLRRIVYPVDGRIAPVILNSGADATLLLNDMRIIPLDVSVEQATQSDADIRFVGVEFIEIDPTLPLVHVSGDNDDSVNRPKATFTVSDSTPARGQWITLTSTSTGQFDSWEWTIGRGSGNPVGKFYTEGPHKVRWNRRGRFRVKLRVYGSGAGASTVSKVIEVH